MKYPDFQSAVPEKNLLLSVILLPFHHSNPATGINLHGSNATSKGTLFTWHMFLVVMKILSSLLCYENTSHLLRPQQSEVLFNSNGDALSY